MCYACGIGDSSTTVADQQLQLQCLSPSEQLRIVLYRKFRDENSPPRSLSNTGKALTGVIRSNLGPVWIPPDSATRIKKTYIASRRWG